MPLTDSPTCPLTYLQAKKGLPQLRFSTVVWSKVGADYMAKQDFIASRPSTGSMDQEHATELRLIARVALGCQEPRKRAREEEPLRAEEEPLRAELVCEGLLRPEALRMRLRVRGGAAYKQCKKKA